MARPVRITNSRHPYARKVVPKDVRGILGRTEFKRPLRGATAADVRRLHADALAEWETLIAVARVKARGAVRTMPARDIEAVCGEWYRAEVAAHEADPGAAVGWEETQAALIDRLPPGEDGRPDVAAYTPTPAEMAEVEALWAAKGIAADGPTVLHTARRLVLAKIRACGTLHRRAEGDYGPDRIMERFPAPLPAVPTVAAPLGMEAPTPAPPLTLASLLADWAKDRQPSVKTLQKYRATLNRVAAFVGFDDVARVTVENVRRFKASRQDAGFAAKTIRDEMGGASTVFRWGVRVGLLASNPFQGQSPRPLTRAEGPRDPYSTDDAARLLRASRQETGLLRWLPWLLCFTGCRIAEVVGLRRCDVRHEGTVLILDIRPTPERPLKTTTSQRMIPVHPAVLAEGFEAYLATVPAHGLLFPDLAGGRNGPASIAERRHSRWVRQRVGITDTRLAPSHAFRHRLQDELRRLRVQEEVVDALTGRNNPRNAGAGYGRGFRRMPDEILKDLQRLRSPLISDTNADVAVAATPVLSTPVTEAHAPRLPAPATETPRRRRRPRRPRRLSGETGEEIAATAPATPQPGLLDAGESAG